MTGLTGLVLAGSRPSGDPLARACGVSYKALVEVAGLPMLLHVVQALRAAEQIERIVVCGLPESALAGQTELRSLLAAGEITLVPGDATPSASVARVLSQGAVAPPLLVTTADHPLLTPAIVDTFCRQAVAADCDVGVGLVSAHLVREAFPEGRRTYLRFREDAYCGCNLYALLTPRSARAPQSWVRIEAYRKQPWRMIGFVGISAIARYLTGQLTLEAVLKVVSERIGIDAKAVLLSSGEAGFDVDKLSDLELTEQLLRQRKVVRPST